MEELATNVHVEVNELHHHDVTPNQSICKEIKNVAVAAEEITENPEYLIMRRRTAIQAVTNEEVVIPKQEFTLRRNFTAVCSESGGTMEMEVSSQESAMDIASQESISVKDSISEESSNCNNEVSISSREEAVLAKEEEIRKREEAVLKSEKKLIKHEDDVLQFERKLKKLEEEVAERERIVFQSEVNLRERQEMLNRQAIQIAARELTLKTREAAIQIREFEADGYEVILQGNNCNEKGHLAAKRSKKI